MTTNDMPRRETMTPELWDELKHSPRLSSPEEPRKGSIPAETWDELKSRPMDDPTFAPMGEDDVAIMAQGEEDTEMRFFMTGGHKDDEF